ncbi:MAG: stalk domain-containing protein [bacterium]
MRRSGLAFFCFALMLITMVVGGSASVEAAPAIKLLINNEQVATDVAPTIVNNRTMVPLRVVSEGLGAQVHWDDKTRSVTVFSGGQEIKLGIGEKTATVNGEKRQIDAPAMIIKNRTMVPLRFIGEALGAQVEWNNNTRTVSVFARGAEITSVFVRQENGREVVAIAGTGLLKGSVLQSENQIVIRLPESTLQMPPGPLSVQDALIKGIAVSQVGTEAEPVVEVVIDLVGPTPFTLTSSAGELAVVLPHRVEGLEYRQENGADVLRVTTTGTVPYTLQQLAEPERLVVDMPGVVPGAAPKELAVETALTQKVRLGESAGGVRLVLDQNRATKYQVTPLPDGLEIRLAAQITGFTYKQGLVGGEVHIQATGPVNVNTLRLSDPERLVLDFPGTIMNVAETVLKIDDTTVREVRAGQFAVDPDLARVVVELKSYVSHEVVPGDNPGEIILNVSSSPVAGRYIAVDPGHGGREPGAVSQSGLLEKDINAAIAARVAELLRIAGAKVLMVREGDDTVDFRDRPEIANKAGVEAFVSIHCNSFTEASKRGTEVYYCQDGREGKKLAEAIHKELIPTLGLPDRGDSHG